MTIIPLTLTISLCLVFTFVLFFLYEQSHRQFDGTESESLLPLAEETPRLAHRREGASNCGCHRGQRVPCTGCLKAGAVGR